MSGRTIRIFLVDGDPSGFRTAELGLSTIKAVVVPRGSLSAVAGRAELQKTGVYVLVGDDSDNPGQKRIYIGEGDVVITRLMAHTRDPDKDFWDEAVVFVSKDENITKAHVRFLEARLINQAKLAKRCAVSNGTAPPDQGKLPEPDEVDMLAFIEQARLLLGTLGINVFEQVTSPVMVPIPRGEEENIGESVEFEYSGDGYNAVCVVDLRSGQFVVKQGSEARKTDMPSLRPTYRTLRAQLHQKGVLVDAGASTFKFSQNYAFSSASASAAVVAGTSVNGRVFWRQQGSTRTFADWEDERLSAKDITQVAT